jgi:DNA repair exonuclease SbcCD ATPase subunit
MTKNQLYRLAAILVCLLAASSVSWAQQPASPAKPPAPASNNCQVDGQQLKMLFDEVRQLRRDLRKISVDTHRLLAVSDQHSRQQARVDALTREIERLKSQLSSVEDTGKDEEALKEIETALNETGDPRARAQLVQAHAVFKSTLDKQKRRNEEFIASGRTKLQQLEYKLVEEQERLSGLRDEMERLNRELDRLAVERGNKN